MQHSENIEQELADLRVAHDALCREKERLLSAARVMRRGLSLIASLTSAERTAVRAGVAARETLERADAIYQVYHRSHDAAS